MGNQIKKLTSISNAHKNGFIRIDTNIDNNFSEMKFMVIN